MRTESWKLCITVLLMMILTVGGSWLWLGAPASAAESAPVPATDKDFESRIKEQQQQINAQQQALESLKKEIERLKQGPPAPVQGPPALPQAGAQPPAPSLVEKRLDLLEEFKARVEQLPSLSNKINLGLNALQWWYQHTNAHVPEGKSQDDIFIRRAEFLIYGTLSDYVPRWHFLSEFQSAALSNSTPNTPGQTGLPASTTIFRESFIDLRPSLTLAPYLNFFRFGIFRMPFGIFTQTSGGFRDVINSPYLTTVGTGNGNATGAAGKIDFLQERDFFGEVNGTLFNRLEYVAGVMNNNNFTGSSLTGIGANGPKAFYTRFRFNLTDVSFVSFTTIQGESNNAGTQINGRGKGNLERYGLDFRYVSKRIPGLYMQGEWWTGHDAPNATNVGLGANGACQNTAICGGTGAPGVQRQTWYVYTKYLVTEGPFRNFEPVVWYEQFDPNTNLNSDKYTRTTLGLNYYIMNLPPKIQVKLMFNYEFRHHSTGGQGNTGNTFLFGGHNGSINDPFAQNFFVFQIQARYQ